MEENGRGASDGQLIHAEDIEAEWNRAVVAASDAVGASGRAGTLGQPDLAAEARHISDERQWLSGFATTLRRLFP